MPKTYLNKITPWQNTTLYIQIAIITRDCLTPHALFEQIFDANNASHRTIKLSGSKNFQAFPREPNDATKTRQRVNNHKRITTFIFNTRRHSRPQIFIRTLRSFENLSGAKRDEPWIPLNSTPHRTKSRMEKKRCLANTTKYYHTKQ